MKDEKTIATEGVADEATEAKSQTSAKMKNASHSAANAEREAFARKIKITLPRKPELGKKQQEYYSVNGRNYLVQLGKEIEVPEPVYNLVMQNRKTEDAAYEYESSLPTASDPQQK